ncbi:MAG: phosphoribosylamine--glycine ligase [Bacteroidales bacterium]
MEKKKILLIGRWGKTHAFAKAIKEKSRYDTEVYCFMDKPNAGIIKIVTDYRIGNLRDNDKIIEYALEKNIDFAIAVPHLALSNSIVDEMIEKGIRCVGPTEKCSRLETDKSFLRKILNELNPDFSPKHEVFNSKDDAIGHIKSIDYDFAVKPVGVTEGDGVKVIGIQLKDKAEAIDYVDEIFKKNIGGIAVVIIEEKLVGREFTIQAFVDGETAWGMPATRDYKLLYEGDKGLNTPGMGSISFPDHLLPFLSKKEYNASLDIMTDVIRHLTIIYREIFIGFLSGQFIKTNNGIKVIEFNVRPGDSEILNIVPILKTDFVDICEAMIDRKLHDMQIEYENKATVCKYIVNKGFPTPKEDMKMVIDEKAIEDGGGDLFYSCFQVAENVYKPSPRGIAVTAKGDTLNDAYQLCEKLIKNHIKGEDIWHREDIGTKELLEKYTLD